VSDEPRGYDNGGWLPPGRSGVNLSGRPEPVYSAADLVRYQQYIREHYGNEEK